VDDLEHRHQADPRNTAANLATSLGDLVIQILRRLLIADPDSSPPR